MKPESSKMPLPPQVEAWLSEMPPSERRSLEETWHRLERARPAMDISDQRRKAEVWAAVSNATKESAREDVPRPRMRIVRSTTRRWVAAAAVVALLIGVGYMLRPITVHAPNGEFVQATLPDGSNVQLNSGSTLTYPARFLGSRNVELDGEAFFDVTEDDDAFVVQTFNARTTVLGTEFNVRARSEEPTPSTSVVVASGRVLLQSASGDDEGVVLTTGRRSIVQSDAPASEPNGVSIDRELVWRHGGLAFSDQPFSAIFAELERRFDMEISAPAEIAGKPFSFYVHEPRSGEAVLADLAHAEGLRYRETATGFEVYRP